MLETVVSLDLSLPHLPQVTCYETLLSILFQKCSVALSHQLLFISMIQPLSHLGTCNHFPSNRSTTFASF